VPQPNGEPRRTRRLNGTETPVSPAAVPPQQVIASLEVLQAEFEATVASNQARFAELSASGAAPDPISLVHARINHLIDSISQFAGPNGPRWAAVTRLQFEQYIAGELAQAAPALRRMQMAEGARYTPSMIAELARQTGVQRRAH
jgi:hypothetical protein